MTAAESLNNAIGRLDFVARIAPIDAERKRAILKLASHWQKYFWRRDFRSLPPTTYQVVLESYARWYTRAYQLLPEVSRAQCTAPTDLDVSFGRVIEDEVQRIAQLTTDIATVTSDAIAAGRQTASKLADIGEKAASAIAEASDKFLSRVERDVFVLLGAALAALYFWTRR